MSRWRTLLLAWLAAISLAIGGFGLSGRAGAIDINQRILAAQRRNPAGLQTDMLWPPCRSPEVARWIEVYSGFGLVGLMGALVSPVLAIRKLIFDKRTVEEGRGFEVIR